MDGRFIVPQFIEEESRILGKITVRQFIIVVVAGVIEMIIFRVASLGWFFGSLFFVAAPALVIAFIKINGQSFHLFLLNVIQSLRRPRLRVWNRNVTMEELKFEMERKKMGEKKIVAPKITKEPLSSSRLAELALVVDTGGMYKGE
ncbi:MAG: PrgI family protein [Patescibacteria group bacterium]|nr:PrgI family protein [Patescibacteria group bacterium]